MSTPQISAERAQDLPEHLDKNFVLKPIVGFSETDASLNKPLIFLQLTLPPAFGSAYVGETFSCTLCANNELAPDAERVIKSVKITAEMQAPSGTLPLDLTPPDDHTTKNDTTEPGASLQKIVHFDLREEGNHILLVSLSYSETTMSKDMSASSGRLRTFRKLYQFVAQPCLSVRTKVSDFTALETKETPEAQRYALEAQLENMADGSISLSNVQFNAKQPFRSSSLNWDDEERDGEGRDAPILRPRDVWQVAFLIEEQADSDGEGQKDIKDGRTVLGQLSMQWRTAFGDQGLLNTGWLMTKKR